MEESSCPRAFIPPSCGAAGGQRAAGTSSRAGPGSVTLFPVSWLHPCVGLMSVNLLQVECLKGVSVS